MKFVLLLVQLLFAQSVFAQANIRFDTMNIDCGIIESGSGTYNKDIRFTNTGDDTLTIEKAYTSDGGSFATYPKESIAPGTTGVITFHLGTQHKRPSFERTLVIHSDAAREPTVLRLTGRIE